MATVDVYLEVGRKRAFAGAIDWPGWCRGGHTEADALANLLAYGPRYGRVVAGIDPSFAPPEGPGGVTAIERLPGDATTDFGAPGRVPAADARPLDDDELSRQGALLDAAWAALDAAALAATGVELRRGPRGGGRGLEAILSHVRDAEVAYLSRLGAKVPPAAAGDAPPAGHATPAVHAPPAGGARDDLARERRAVRDALQAVARGEPPVVPTRSGGRWTPRYFVRRAAWHVLDHAWEIEDRAAR